MEEQFTHIATVTFQHTYFENGLFKTLEMHPEAVTIELLHRFKLIIKPFVGGMDILASLPEFLETAITDESLRFEMNCSDTFYMNYTALPTLNLQEEVLYYDNLQTNDTEIDAQYILKRAIYSRSQITNSFRKTLGVLALYPKALVEHYLENEAVVAYTINFEARKTYWKYIIIHQPSFSQEYLAIENSAGEQIFEQISAEIDKVVFLSKAPIALAEKPKGISRLIRKAQSLGEGDRTLFAHLPGPSPDRSFPPDDPSLEAYFSHIYIYI